MAQTSRRRRIGGGSSSALVMLLLSLLLLGPTTTHAFLVLSHSKRSASAQPWFKSSDVEDAVVHDTAVEEEVTQNEVLWEPSNVEETAMYQFMLRVGIDSGKYEDLWRWSIDESDEFWKLLVEFTGVEFTGSLEPVKKGETMPDVEYFPAVRLNFAQNMLRAADDPSTADAEALASLSEARKDVRWTFSELRDDASRVANVLRQLGVDQDAACCAYMPNVGETVVQMLGVTGTGGVWSSCSPDFGPTAVADRFAQIRPKVLFTVDGYVSKGKPESLVDKVERLAEALPTLELIVVLPLLGESSKRGDVDLAWKSDTVKSKIVSWQDLMREGSNADGSAPEPRYAQVPFAHPQFVLYSSGTTGAPKCIAHGTGNVLLTHAKELMLHSDLRPGDRLLFYTTAGWMMWNWMASALFCRATCVVFDGFAAHPRLVSPWDVVERERVTHMGTTPRYLQSCRKRVRPGETHDLSALRVVLSTGSPLLPEDFDYVYRKVKENVMLASVSGGTDICSCFALGNPLLPVRRSELQAIGLGLDVAALDKDSGEAVPVGAAKGELACRSPFVSAPVCFFGDDENKSRYRNAYFDKDDGVWYHGDLIQVTGSVGKAGGLIIHGRSDTTLNPGGIRIGTAEVYRFAESVDFVQDSLVIGETITRGKRSDVRIVLFVKLPDGMELDEDKKNTIKETIRLGASDAHVPALIKQVQVIPYTKSGKKVETAVRDLFAGVEPKNVGALQDPTAFDEYRAMAASGL